MATCYGLSAVAVPRRCRRHFARYAFARSFRIGKTPFVRYMYSPLLRCSHHTKPEVLAATISVTTVRDRNSTAACRDAPAAATSMEVVVVDVVLVDEEGIPTPFPHITAHVVQAESVCFLTFYGMSFTI